MARTKQSARKSTGGQRRPNTARKVTNRELPTGRRMTTNTRPPRRPRPTKSSKGGTMSTLGSAEEILASVARERAERDTGEN
ncbi:hypothetical protein FRB99_009049 [Tulasnella sp. 403]|nr:hypothetical protein FRB99_009049 [Tulasnella sp. 403]